MSSNFVSAGGLYSPAEAGSFARTPDLAAPASDTPTDQTLVSDNEALVTATDNGDGSFTVAAVGGLGNLGVANLTYSTTLSNGASIERVEAVNVIAGGAETVTFEFGEETETTPDTPAPGPAPEPEPTPEP